MLNPQRAALYTRVSTADQHTENQLLELRQFAAARGWTVVREYEDAGVSGAKESRPALNALVQDARRRRFDVLVCWRLDRLGRNLRHLVLLLDELHALGVSFASLNEGIDATTPAGRLQMHMLAALSEFERGRIQERVRAGLARARAWWQAPGASWASSARRRSRTYRAPEHARRREGAGRIRGAGSQAAFTKPLGASPLPGTQNSGGIRRRFCCS